MRERVTLAAFGGVYSNHLALRAVLEDIAHVGADGVWCLGDLGGFGPNPDRAAELLRERNIPMLRGNYDDSIGFDRADCACGYTDPRDNRFAQVSFDYTAAHTSPEHKRWMRSLDEQHAMLAGGRRVLLCHGSPRRVNEFLWESTTSDAFLESLCNDHRAEVILCTHTGLRWHRRLASGRHVINVGAIGRPGNDGRAGVWYAVLHVDEDVTVEFRCVEYDHASLAREMRSAGLPGEFIETIETGWWTTCLENMPAPERLRGPY